MEASINTYISLLIIISLAVAVPMLLSKFKKVTIPGVVGEILVGIIIGESGFNLIHDGVEIEFLNSFGFAFLMFLSGLEVDFSLLRTTKENRKDKIYEKPIALGVLIFIGTLIMSFAFSFALERYGLVGNSMLMTLILSTTSLGIVVPILKERNIISTEYGQTILMAALVADFATMVLITVFISFRTNGANFRAFLVVILFMVFFIFLRVGRKFVDNEVLREMTNALSNTTAQIKVRGSFALILVFIALANLLGTEVILGAFLAGAIVSILGDREASDLHYKLDAIGYGFFIPIFFILVGVSFDLQAVLANPKSMILVPILILIVYVVKLVPSLLLLKKFETKKTIAAGFLLSSRLSLIIAASSIGLELGLITSEVNAAIILVAIITCTFSPMLFEKILPEEIIDNRKRITVIGVNGQTAFLMRRLRANGALIEIISNDPENCEKYIEGNKKIHMGNPENLEFMYTTNICEADTVIVSMDDEELDYKICRILHNTFNKEHVAVLTEKKKENPDREFDVTKYGAVKISPDLATVVLAENYVENPNTYDLMFKEGSFAIIEVVLRNNWYYGRELSDISLPGDCLILSIMREGNKIIPHGNNMVLANDSITIVGSSESVQEAKQRLSYTPKFAN